MAQTLPKPPASFGGADTLSYKDAEVCPLLRTKQCTVDSERLNMSLLRSEDRCSYLDSKAALVLEQGAARKKEPANGKAQPFLTTGGEADTNDNIILVVAYAALRDMKKNKERTQDRKLLRTLLMLSG